MMAILFLPQCVDFAVTSWHTQSKSGIILWMHPANERWCYIVTSSLIGWVHAQNDPWKYVRIVSNDIITWMSSGACFANEKFNQISSIMKCASVYIFYLISPTKSILHIPWWLFCQVACVNFIVYDKTIAMTIFMKFCILLIYHWNNICVILTKFSPLAAVVKMTTSNDANFIKMMTFSFQYMYSFHQAWHCVTNATCLLSAVSVSVSCLGQGIL